MNNFIYIDKKSKDSIRKQIIDNIIDGIQKGELSVNQKLPSINKLCKDFKISRDTVISAYRKLIAQDIIYALQGKGYFINKSRISITRKVFFSINTLNSFGEITFNSFKEKSKSFFKTDLFIHGNDMHNLYNLLKRNKKEYDYFIIFLSHNFSPDKLTKLLPKNKTILINQVDKKLREIYTSIHRDFESEILDVLIANAETVKKFKQINIIYRGKIYPKALLYGLDQFCYLHEVVSRIVHKVDEHLIEKDTLYVVTNQFDLAYIIEKSKENQWILGKDIGIISWYDSPLNTYVEGGISTIAVDYEKVGATVADRVIKLNKDNFLIQAEYLSRKSL